MAKKKRKHPGVNRPAAKESGTVSGQQEGEKGINRVAWIVWAVLFLGFVGGVYAYAYYGDEYVNSLDDQIGEVLVARANRAEDQGRIEDAVSLYREALSQSFDNPANRVRTRQELARILISDSRPSEAVTVIEKAVEQEPGDLTSYAILTRAIRDSGDPKELLDAARRWFEAAEGKGDRSHMMQARVNEGDAMLRAGKREEALEAFLDANRLEKSAPAALKAARILCDLGRYDEAEPLLQQVKASGAADMVREARELEAQSASSG